MTICSLTTRFITKTRNLSSSDKSKEPPLARCIDSSTHGLKSKDGGGQVTARLDMHGSPGSQARNTTKKPAQPVFFH